ncbi:15803_t:CDS:1, partial [Cetraspora pellucida]
QHNLDLYLITEPGKISNQQEINVDLIKAFIWIPILGVVHSQL